jgi:sigma-B regulation protein RsbU (phosphoserine phosphatase)
VLLGWVTLSLFGSLRNVQKRVFETAIPELVAVDEIVRSYTAQSAAIRGYLISFSPTLLDQYRMEVDVAAEWEEVASELNPGVAEGDLLGRLIEAGKDFHDLVAQDVLPLAEEGQRSQAFRVLGLDGDPLVTRIELLGEQLRLAQDRVMADAEETLSTRGDQAILILILVTVGSVLIGLVLAIFLPKRLSRNLDALVTVARGIERGDFNQRIDIHSGDEVEELANRFEEMQAGLQKLQQLRLQERELEIAASIQRNLLQRSIPEPRGVALAPMQRQANLVGGDWYDLEISGKSLSVAIGDASGKGIAAALMATVMLSSLRAERGLGAGPKRLIERANRALKDATESDAFTTLVYLIIDTENGQTRWFNMGHPDPFLLRARPDGSFEGGYLDGVRNKALGWFEDPGLEDNITELLPGDRLVLYTDGYLEAKAASGELFGETRLAAALIKLAPLDAANLEAELVGEVERFAAGKLDDDLTMLIVDYLGTEE